MCSASVRMAIAKGDRQNDALSIASTAYLRHHKLHKQHHTHVHTCARCTAVGRVSAIRVDGSLSTASVVVRCTVLERRVAAAYSPSTHTEPRTASVQVCSSNTAAYTCSVYAV